MKSRMDTILVPANPGPRGKWPLKRKEIRSLLRYYLFGERKGIQLAKFPVKIEVIPVDFFFSLTKELSSCCKYF